MSTENDEMRKVFGGTWPEIFDHMNIPKSVDYVHNNQHAHRILTICRGGNVRSAALAFLLKYKYGCDAIAASMEKNNATTIDMLLDWADIVLIVEEKFRDWLPTGALHKTFLCEIPTDVWANPLDLDLLEKADQKIQQLGNLVIA